MCTQSCLTLVNSWTINCQVCLSMGFFWQEYWNGLPFPPPGDLPHPGIKPVSPASLALVGRFFFSFLFFFFTTVPLGNPYIGLELT